MGRIAILPDPVADQIAAGEVVERPASVVKELVENALDAGATSITVEVTAGGKRSIVVTDDGLGMDRDDAVLAVDRHATSKIHNASDLIGVATYGFRGEALPAIASISQFELETAAAKPEGGAGEATRIVVQGGRMQHVETSARQHGTTVTVKRLFFNTPARRKFLRSTAAETRAITTAVSLLAIARLDVSFKVTHENRVLVDAPRVAAFADRIESLYGARLAGELVSVEHNSNALSVRGFVQRPADARPTGRKALLFVNGRPFRDHFIVRAAEAGYRATIHPGARPTMFISLGVSGDSVDVNVHPSKLEVRFRDRRLVEQTVEDAVRNTLGDFGSAAVVSGPGGSGLPWPGADHAGSRWSQSSPTDEQSQSLFDSTDGTTAPAAAFSSGRVSTSDDEELLQVFRTYLMFETPEGVAIVDQHSAHERVLYEGVMRQLRDEGAPSQRLLLPITIDMEPRELEAVEQSRDMLGAVGFEVEEFGPRSIALQAVPNPHPRFDARKCFEELIADLARGRFGGWTNQLERFAATYACRAAIKAGQILERQEMRTLLSRLFACELPPHDVHGRPTMVQLPKEELERRFGRS